MTTPNYFGWTESEDRIRLRMERSNARALAYEVWNASTLTDAEIMALDVALDAAATDPAHCAVAWQAEVDKRVADIENALNNEPLTKEQALELLDELGEITTAQIRDGVSSPEWFAAQKERSDGLV